MPVYHFNIDDGLAAVPCDGAVLPDLAAAKCEAVRMMGRMICDAGESFWQLAEWKMTVTDEVGLTLFELNTVGTESPAVRLAAA